MKRLTVEAINRLAADPAHRSVMLPPHPVNHARPFLPEEHTQLFYAPLYATLTPAQRLRYNQLFALRINEFIMMLEQDLNNTLLAGLQRNAALDPPLLQALTTIRAEEDQHFAGFAALNRACRPDLYPPGQDRFFSLLPAATRAMFGMVGLLSQRMPFALWFLMAMEESAKTLARDMMRNRTTITLGPLDDAFVHAHLEHLKDETRHIHIDSILIEKCLQPRWQGVNAWLFMQMLVGVTRPTRGGSGVRVIRQLVRDLPELAPREEEMIQAVLALRDNRAFQQSLFNRRIMPETFAIFDRCPAFAGLGDKLVGYDRQPAT
jgi:hypothetical protein